MTRFLGTLEIYSATTTTTTCECVECLRVNSIAELMVNGIASLCDRMKETKDLRKTDKFT